MQKSAFKGLISAGAVLTASLALSACNINIGGMTSGVPLSELDMSGDAPVEIGLAGPDDVILEVGGKLDIQVDGDPKVRELLRFDRSGSGLTIGRDSDWKGGSSGKATITVTMPAPREVSLAGSGTITAPTLAKKSDISIAGSGTVTVSSINSEDLEVSMAGSGRLNGSGTTDKLDVSIAGSGEIDLEGLSANDVEISIAGSGDISLASDGKVTASIAGSGDINVTGTADCNLDSMGSGRMNCKPAGSAEKPATKAAKVKKPKADKPE